MLWEEQSLLDAIATEFEAHEASLIAENAIKGLDSLDELSIHPIVAAAISKLGFGVFREFPFPGSTGKRRKKMERTRCDFVLTHDSAMSPGDPVARDIRAETKAATLFADTPPLPDHTTPICECLFLECKVVGQYVYLDGVPGPNRTYASSLIRAVAGDLKKLGEDEKIAFGAVLLIHFTADEGVAKHDLMMALHRALDRKASFRSPIVRHLRIPERIGNTCCTISIIGKSA
jgi:hypothetical protein